MKRSLVMDIEEVLSSTLLSLNLSMRVLGKIVVFILQNAPSSEIVLLIPPYGQQHRSQVIQEYAAGISIREVIQLSNRILDTKVQTKRIFSKRDIQYQVLMELYKKVEALGLTQIDWIALPRDTVTREKLKAVDKEAMKKKSIMLLDTLTNQAIDKIFLRFPNMKIGQLVQTSAEDLPKWYGFQTAMQTTRQLLRDLGFKYEDGLFLQEGTWRWFEEYFEKKYALPVDTAVTLLNIIRAEQYRTRTGKLINFSEWGLAERSHA